MSSWKVRRGWVRVLLFGIGVCSIRFRQIFSAIIMGNRPMMRETGSRETERPVLLMIAGPNGSGKSSILRHSRMVARLDRIVNPDNYARSIQGIPDETERYIMAMTQCAELRNQLLTDRISFGFETVASTQEKMDFVKRAISSGYEFEFLFMNAGSPEICIERIRQRVAMGGHDVPEEKVRSRYEKTMGYLPEYLQLADSAMVFDNSGDDAVLMAYKRGGAVIITEEGLQTRWVRTYLNQFIDRI